MSGWRSWKVGVLWLAGEPRAQVLAGGHGRVDGVVAGEQRAVIRVTRVCCDEGDESVPRGNPCPSGPRRRHLWTSSPCRRRWCGFSLFFSMLRVKTIPGHLLGPGQGKA
jgi:hypothetical protein